MASNLNEQALELEKALRQHENFVALQQAYADVNKDSEAKQLFDQFRNIQLQLQQKQMSGQEITQEEVEQAQQVAGFAQSNEKIVKLMESEQALSATINDLNKIIMKPLEELYGSNQ